MASRMEKAFTALVATPALGRAVLWLAVRLVGPYKRRRKLAEVSGRAIVAPGAEIRCPRLVLGRGAYVDSRCLIFSHDDRSSVTLGDGSSILNGTIIEVGIGGEVSIGAGTHIQAYSILAGFGRIAIGRNVQVAPRCSFYPYSHSFSDLDVPISRQPIETKGGIVVEDDVWLGVGVTVLDGVRIGQGSVVGAGAVVTRDVPPRAVAAGAPARVLRMRDGSAIPASLKES